MTEQWKVFNWVRIFFSNQQKSEVITPIKEGICYLEFAFVQSCERIQRGDADKTETHILFGQSSYTQC